MGTCTSTARHRQKHQQPNRTASNHPINLDIQPPPPLPPHPITVFPKQQIRYPQSVYTDFDILSSSSTSIEPIFHQTDTNSLIQLYSSNTNNNNNNNSPTIINYMSSSTSSVTHIPPRIPVPKNRLPVYLSSQNNQSTVIARPKSVTSTVLSNNQIESVRPISMTNRAPPPTAMQTRFGFIPRPTAPGTQQYRTSTLASRSRSVSPTSTVSANSSSSSSLISQHLTKPTTKIPSPNQSIPPTLTTTTNPTKPKTIISPRTRDTSVPKSTVRSTLQSPTAASRMRSRTPSRTSSAASPTSSVTSPLPSSSSSNTTATLKTDVNAIRDRYRTQKRMNFFIRHTPIPTANGSPVASSTKSPNSSISSNEKKPLPPPPPTTTTKIISNTHTNNNNSKSKTPPQTFSPHGDSAYGSVTYPSNQTPSAHLSQSNRHRQRAISMLSTTSAISDVLNQDALLEDDNCSLKSDDLMCDYDDTLTIDSTSRNDQTDSCSSISLTIESTKKYPTIISVTPTKPNGSTSSSSRQSTSKERQSTNEKSNGNLRESLDELNRLSHRMDNSNDNEQNRKPLTRSVSLKPPTSYLPPLDDAEQITMDIESYRQVMKDVMIVKTVLHQLDRLLKHSDGANMTDSMIGSLHEFHDSIYHGRRLSTSVPDGNLRSSIDENSSYDDLMKEIIALRKEKEQDKQTIKLLQEQMYKYSSQTNG